jgi:hypothetical protein
MTMRGFTRQVETKSMAGKWQSEPKRWRVRGKSPADGMVVTLGRYDTEQEAQAACDTLMKQKTYVDPRVEPIVLPSLPAPPV